jgi:hypothetical protein
MDLNLVQKIDFSTHLNGASDTSSLDPHAGLGYDGATMIRRV